MSVQPIAGAVSVIHPITTRLRIKVEIELDPIHPVPIDQAAQRGDGPSFHSGIAEAHIAQPLASARGDKLGLLRGQAGGLTECLAALGL